MKLFTVIALLATANAIRIMSPEKKPEIKNIGNSNDLALTAGQKVAAEVVAKCTSTDKLFCMVIC